MIIAMIAMRVMQSSVDQVIDVVSVRYGFMSATRSMLVPRAFRVRSAALRVAVSDLDDMFVNVVAVHVV